jgi:hypothetical protein
MAIDPGLEYVARNLTQGVESVARWHSGMAMPEIDVEYVELCTQIARIPMLEVC